MNPVVHFEMPYENADRCAKFYSTVFAWKTQMYGPEMGNYIVVTTAEKDAMSDGKRGAINGGFFPKKPDWPAQYPNIVISVSAIRDSMKTITQNGGKVLGEPMMIPEVGEFVSFMDPEGNRVAILQPKM